MQTQAYNVIVRRLSTGCDYSIRLFARDAGFAKMRATDRAWFACGIRATKMRELNAKGIAVFRVVSCELSADQRRPLAF
ncbi:MAG: hypothetical protein ACHP7H_00375 [Hyphomicrobiales bacterium]